MEEELSAVGRCFVYGVFGRTLLYTWHVVS